MKKWTLTASRTGEYIDFECVILAEFEPDFWTCYNIAAANGCDFFSIEEAGTV